MSSHIFNIQNSVNITKAIQSIQAGLVDENRNQHAGAVGRQEAVRAARRRQVTELQEGQATIDLSHNESSQRAIYKPLPRKRKDRDEDAPEDKNEKPDETDVKHIDITV